MKYLAITLSLLFVLSCNNTPKQEKETSPKKELEMYQASEMAELMNVMYAKNLKLKQAIISGKDIGEFSEDILKLHSAKMTKGFERTEAFQNFSKLFISVEKELYNSTSTTSPKERFNAMVGVCISCHKTECAGPIPRIKKLIIK